MIFFRSCNLFLAWLFLIFVGSELPAQEPRLTVIPEPQEVIFYESNFEIGLESRIALGEGSDEADFFTAGQLNQRLQELSGIQLKVLKESEVSNWSNVIFFGKLEESPKAREMTNNSNFTTLMEIGQEGYFLQSSDSLVVIAANTSQGLYYGCMTFNQLVHKEGERLFVSGVTIYDWPAFQFRGISDDISHGQIPKLEYFMRIIHFISRYKINTYMLYINDKFQFENHPKIAEGKEALTKSEMAELEAFAKKYHVQIIPIFDTFAHMENILLLPQYSFLAEFPGASSLAPVNEEVYQFLDELIFEISESFSSPYLHVGGDGVFQLGWGASKKMVENSGLAGVYASHYKRVCEIAKNYDKQVMMSGEMMSSDPTMLYQIPTDVIFVDSPSQVNETYPSIENFFRSGRKFMVSPSLCNDRRIFPDYLEAFSNIKKMIQSGAVAGALGAITANYNALGATTFREYNWYGYALTAECSWSPTSVDIERFNKKFFPQFFGKDTLVPEIIYTLLMELADQELWRELWRHPFLSPITDNDIIPKRIYRLKTQMSQVMELIDSFSNTASRNREHLDYLRFAAEQGAWIAKRFETVKEVEQFSKNFNRYDDARNVNRIIDKCLEVVEDLNQILEDLQLLWLRNYRAAGLPLLLDLYGYQIDYWQEKIDQIQRGHLSENPLLESQWIYHPSLEIGGGPEQSVPHAFFRRTFEVLPGLRKAYLQAIAHSHLKIYLNGGFLGEVIDSETTSLQIESQRVKMWDITPLLHPGKNVIAVEAWNYAPNHSAGLNIYGEIVYELGKTTKIKSDAYWKASSEEENNWRMLGFFDVQWLNAVPGMRNVVITKPKFNTGRASRIEW